MKIKQTGMMLLMMLLMSFFYSTRANAEVQTGWYVCKIDSMGTTVYKQRYRKNGKLLTRNALRRVIELDDIDGAFTDKAFALHGTAAKEMMAIVLTAMSHGYDIEVFVDASSSFPVISKMFLLSTSTSVAINSSSFSGVVFAPFETNFD